MTSILIITLHYRPEPNFIITDIAESYARLGHKVTVITAFPNYPYGRYYRGYGHWRPRRSKGQDVLIWRVPHFVDHSTSRLRRACSYISFTMVALVAG